MSDSLLLIHGCPVFLGTVRSHRWLWTQSWRSRASLSSVAWSCPLLLLRLQAEKWPCSLLQEADRGRKDGIHGPRTPLASRRQRHRHLCQWLAEKPTSHSPHHVPDASPSSHSQDKALHFLSPGNIRARVAKLKKKKSPACP